jgi:hypothetical protein
MNERDIQEILTALFDTLIDAKDEVAEDDDELPDITALADTLVELVNTTTGIAKVRSFGDAMLLTSNEGVILTTDDGSEFQITIVQSRHPA